MYAIAPQPNHLWKNKTLKLIFYFLIDNSLFKNHVGSFKKINIIIKKIFGIEINGFLKKTLQLPQVTPLNKEKKTIFEKDPIHELKHIFSISLQRHILYLRSDQHPKLITCEESGPKLVCMATNLQAISRVGEPQWYGSYI